MKLQNFSIFALSALFHPKEELIRVQKSSLGHVVQSWTILKMNKGHNSVKIKQKHNNIFSTEKIRVI